MHYLSVLYYVDVYALVHVDARTMPKDIVRADTYLKLIWFTLTNYFRWQLGINCQFVSTIYLLCNAMVNMA
jgi:hypothetical protein